MSSVVQILSPQAEELRGRRREMADLRRKLADKELELSTAKAELNIFEQRYQKVVSPMYAELDGVKAQVLGLACKFYPKAENFREEAESAREQANEFKEEQQEKPQEKPAKEFNPPEILKKLFRRVAKKIHPDLASSTTERERRHELMAKLNQAYDRLDEEAIRSILVEWEEPFLDTYELGEQLVRVMSQMAQVRKRLNEIMDELEDLMLTEMFQLKQNVDSAKREGHDLLEEIADDIEKKIKKTKAKIRDLAYDFI